MLKDYTRKGLSFVLGATVVMASLAGRSFAQFNVVIEGGANANAAAQWLYAPVETPMSYSPEQLVQIVKLNYLPANNNYFIKADFIFDILKASHNFDKMLFYDADGRRCLVIPEDVCEAPNLVETLSTDLDKYPLSKTDSLSLMLSKLTPCTSVAIDRKLPTALLLWNRTFGIAQTDNVFEKLRKIKDKFQGQINILMVNTDAINVWPYPVQAKYLDDYLKPLAEKLQAIQAFQK